MPPDDRSRPKAAPESTATTTSATIPEGALTNAAAIACREWSYRFVRKCSTPVPRFGSPEWLALAEGTPAKVASTTIAAVAWLSDCVNAPANLARELDQRRRLDKAQEDARYSTDAADHRHRWGHLALVPEREDVETRVAKARLPRPGDFQPRRRGGDLDAG